MWSNFGVSCMRVNDGMSCFLTPPTTLMDKRIQEASEGEFGSSQHFPFTWSVCPFMHVYKIRWPVGDPVFVSLEWD